MTQAICNSCQARFEVDFAPGTEFTCGGCGAVVVVPKLEVVQPSRPKAATPASPTAPEKPKAPPPPPRPRVAAAPRPPREQKPAPVRDPVAAKKQKTIILAAVGGTAVICIVLGILIFKDSPADAGPAPHTTPSASPRKEDPKTSAEPATKPAPVVKAPVGERPSDPLGAAKWDAQQEGASIAEKLKYADLAYEKADQLEAEGKKYDAAGVRIEALAAYAEVVRREPNQERARDRMGFVKYDPAEAKRLAAIPNLPRKLKGCLDESIEQIEAIASKQKAKYPIWLGVKEGNEGDVATEWRKALREARGYETLEQEKLTDPFYKKAESMATAVEGDVGPVLKRKKLEGKTFDVFPHKPYVLLVQREKDFDTQEAAERMSETLLQLRETFITRFRKLNLAPMDRPTPVLFLRYDTDYMRYMNRGEAGPLPVSLAHFEPFSKRLVIYKDVDRTDKKSALSPSDDATRTVVFHEGTHQLVDYYTKPRPTNIDEALWFSEGIADYFGGHGRAWDETAGKWRYEPGLLDEGRIGQVGDALEGGYLFKLDDLLAYRRRDYEAEKWTNHVRTGTAYAQGWALVYFLSNWDDNKYRDKFDDYVKKELNGESGPKAFVEVFGADSVDTIEAGLKQMIVTLHKALKEKKIVNGRLQK